MRKALLSIAVLAVALSFGPARADLIYAQLRSASRGVTIDTLFFSFAGTVDTIATPGFEVEPGQTDTTELADMDWPPDLVRGSWVSGGRRMEPFVLTEPILDRWLSLPEEVGEIMFFVLGGIEETGTVAPGPRLAAWPNPFTGRTRLGMELAASTPVTLEVFDASGRHRRTLARQTLGGGNHGFAWDGRDDRNERCGPGVYLARLAAGSTVSVLKLVLED